MMWSIAIREPPCGTETRRLMPEKIGEFEAIVSEMPEHARAVEALGQARARAERSGAVSSPIG